MILLLAGLLATAQPIAMEDPDDPYDQARAMMLAGRFRMAAAFFRAELDKDPNNGMAHGGLAQALTGLGRCYHADEHFAAAWGTSGWVAEVAYAEGTCASRRGQHALAVAAFEDAVTMDPEFARGWYGLAQAAAAVGDAILFEDALEALDGHKYGPHMQALARTWSAFDYGMGDAELELWMLERHLRLGPYREAAWAQLYQLDGRLWLRAGAPEIATESLQEATAGRWDDTVSLAWLAEAYRRAGFVDLAKPLWEGPILTRARLPQVRLLRVLWAVDQSDYALAEELLGYTEGEMAEDWAAARWYLARARGEDTAPWEAMYEGARAPEAEPLAYRVPRAR